MDDVIKRAVEAACLVVAPQWFEPDSRPSVLTASVQANYRQHIETAITAALPVIGAELIVALRKERLADTSEDTSAAYNEALDDAETALRARLKEMEG
jgi:hypothetical protein